MEVLGVDILVAVVTLGPSCGKWKVDWKGKKKGGVEGGMESRECGEWVVDSGVWRVQWIKNCGEWTVESGESS